MKSKFVAVFGKLQSKAHNTAVSKGWWKHRHEIIKAVISYVDSENSVALDRAACIQSDLACLMLMVTELSETAEAIRHGNPADDKIPEFTGAEAELADTIIRIMDLAENNGWRVGEAIEAKMAMNNTRPYMHGGKLA